MKDIIGTKFVHYKIKNGIQYKNKKYKEIGIIISENGEYFNCLCFNIFKGFIKTEINKKYIKIINENIDGIIKDSIIKLYKVIFTPNNGIFRLDSNFLKFYINFEEEKKLKIKYKKIIREEKLKRILN